MTDQRPSPDTRSPARLPESPSRLRAVNEPRRRRAALEGDLDYRPQWDRMTRLMVTVLLIVAVIWLLFLIGPILQTIAVAAIIAFIMFFPARTLTSRLGSSWALSVVLCYGVLLVALIILVVGLAPPLRSGVDSASTGLQNLYENLQTSLENYNPDDWVVPVMDGQIDLNPLISPLRDALVPTPEPTVVPAKDVPFASTAGTIDETVAVPSSGLLGDLGIDLRGVLGQANLLVGTLASAVSTVTGFVSGLLLALFISFLMVLDLPRANRSLADWIPPAYHREAALLFEKIERIWTGFFRGQLVIGFIIGVVTFLQLTIMGAGNALLLAVIVALISLIPTIGGIVALIPLFIGPLVTGSTTFPNMSPLAFALLVVVINLILTQIIWNGVAPKILGDALNLPVVVIIIGVFVGAAVGGILGAFLVTPLISTVVTLFTYLIRKIAQKDPFPDETPAMVLGAAQFAETDNGGLQDAVEDELPLAEDGPKPDGI